MSSDETQERDDIFGRRRPLQPKRQHTGFPGRERRIYDALIRLDRTNI
jgi:hypothetical protein